MRAPPLSPAHLPALAQEKALLAGEVERLIGARPASERPGALREALVRWLNAEL